MRAKWFAVLITQTLAGCLNPPSFTRGQNIGGAATQDDEPPGGGPQPSGDQPVATTPAIEPVPPSSLPERALDLLRFRDRISLVYDLTRAIQMQAGDLCQELDGIPCLGVAHGVAVGGTAIYTGVTEALATPNIASVAAYERIALNACKKRADTDMAAPGSAVMFKGLLVDAAGKITDRSSMAIAIQTVYSSLLLRDPTPAEIDAAASFYDVVAARVSSGAAVEWARLICYVTITSVEFIFY